MISIEDMDPIIKKYWQDKGYCKFVVDKNYIFVDGLEIAIKKHEEILYYDIDTSSRKLFRKNSYYN